MSTQLASISTKDELQVWDKEKRDFIRKTFAPDLTNKEFALFVGMGRSLGANPFMREIWAVKYGNQNAQIFLGRDFYRRKAQEQPTYNGHQVDAVYSNDEFKMVNGKPEHSYSLGERGGIMGAYCVVHVEGREPFFNYVEFDEYDTGRSTWSDKPATMIKKVAEAQSLRASFQGIFQGTYDESEQWKQEATPNKEPINSNDFKRLKSAVKNDDMSFEKADKLHDLTSKQSDELKEVS